MGLVRRGRLIALAAVVFAAAAPVQAASAADPGRWLITGASTVPVEYWQGLTSNPAKSAVYFAGPFQGLWSTTPTLRRTAALPAAIPASVISSEGYNHIGDPTWNQGDGGRVILPLECYDSSANPSNTCGNGAFGVADPRTLAWRYYVKLDRAEIPKAMWAETSPNGRLIWTSSGNDLLAYRSSDVTAAHAAPAAPPIRSVRRLKGAVPPSGVTGGVFVRGRLLLAGVSAGKHQIWSVNTAPGAAAWSSRPTSAARPRASTRFRSRAGGCTGCSVPSTPAARSPSARAARSFTTCGGPAASGSRWRC